MKPVKSTYLLKITIDKQKKLIYNIQNYSKGVEEESLNRASAQRGSGW